MIYLTKKSSCKKCHLVGEVYKYFQTKDFLLHFTMSYNFLTVNLKYYMSYTLFLICNENDI